MKIYSYVIEHDLGLAPNPFGEFCTLAVCKPQIRKSKNLEIGDWIIGTGSRSIEKLTSKPYLNHLIYCMKISEIITLEQYWCDERFQYKKPNTNGSLITMYGDNFYHKVDDKWQQENSAHSNFDGTTNLKHLKKDTKGKNVLISNIFYYFGENAILIPDTLKSVCKNGIGEKIVDEHLSIPFLEWLNDNFDTGIHGNPTNWIIHNQLNLFT
ncbi:hypothetical protein CMT78_03845 [Elizabethkingia anophelis]|nr:hypothetical protein [Elizabethkingia anophelis]